MYKNIVVAYDNSEFSKAALIETSHWVMRNGGKIVLVHVVYFAEEEFSMSPEQLEARLAAGRKSCVDAADLARSEFSIEVEPIIREGEPYKVLIAVAGERKADLIAMGSHGRKGIKRLLMGNVTSKVVALSNCDVLVVKRMCQECTGIYESFLVPYDGSQFSRNALKRASQIASGMNVPVSVLYVIPRYEEMIEFLNSDAVENSLIKEAEMILSSAEEIALEFGIQIIARYERGDAAEKINASAELMLTPLIIMSTYGWTGVSKAVIGSTAERVIADAACPVLVVKAGTDIFGAK